MNPDLTIKSWENKMTIEFTSPELTELTPKITVFGVGGAGGGEGFVLIDGSEVPCRHFSFPPCLPPSSVLNIQLLAAFTYHYIARERLL